VHWRTSRSEVRFPASTALNLSAPPYIAELPAVIESDRNPIPSPRTESVVGPLKSNILWTATVPESKDMSLSGFGRDNTIYLLGPYSIFAVRDGKLRWGYKGGSAFRGARLAIAPDGLVWIKAEDAIYVFNNAGTGGRLESELAQRQDIGTVLTSLGAGAVTPQGPTVYRCETEVRVKALSTRGEPQWTVKLDNDCFRSFFSLNSRVKAKAKGMFRQSR